MATANRKTTADKPKVEKKIAEYDWEALAAPFPSQDIEWRVGSSGISASGKPWIKVLAYVTARAIYDRLDTVIGPDNWRNSQPEPVFEGSKLVGYTTSIQIYVRGEWVAKYDGAQTTQFEGFKGGISGAIKRAAVLWGIGRYLYDLDENWAEILQKREPGCHTDKVKGRDGRDVYVHWRPPVLPDEFVPEEERVSRRGGKPQLRGRVVSESVAPPEDDEPAPEEAPEKAPPRGELPPGEELPRIHITGRKYTADTVIGLPESEVNKAVGEHSRRIGLNKASGSEAVQLFAGRASYAELDTPEKMQFLLLLQDAESVENLRSIILQWSGQEVF